MTLLLLLFTGGCALWDLKKRRISNGMILAGGLLFLLIRSGLGMKIGYTAGWSRWLPGTGAALMSGICEMCGYLVRIGILLCVLFSAVSVSHDRCGRYQDGSGSVWCCGGAAGRADPFMRADGSWGMVSCFIGLAWDCQAAAYISCVLFVPVCAWGKRRAVLSGSAGWKRGIFLSGTVPVFGSDWGGADSVSVRKMACD